MRPWIRDVEANFATFATIDRSVACQASTMLLRFVHVGPEPTVYRCSLSVYEEGRIHIDRIE